MADLKTRNLFCKRIDREISDLKTEWLQGRDQLRNIEFELSDLNEQLATAQNDMQSLRISAIPGRVARLLPQGLVGQALSIADAARVASEGTRIQSEINFVTGKIQRLNATREGVQREQQNLDQNINDGQGKFLEFNCSELGFSHQNLNAPGF